MHPCFMRLKINNSIVVFLYFQFYSFFFNHSLIQAYIHNTKKKQMILLSSYFC